MNLMKLQKCSSQTNYPKLSLFSSKHKLYLSSRPSKSNSPIGKFAIYGTLGLCSVLLTAYGLIRNNLLINLLGNSDNHTQKLVNFTNVDPSLRSTDIAEGAQNDKSLREKHNFIDKVVKKCASAVFYLEIRDPSKRDPESGEPIITSNGSGFIISEDGYALTNAHVVLNKPQSTITATFRDGNSYAVKVEDADINMDLALLKVTAPHALPTLQFGEKGDTTVGEWVVALGSPLSLSNSVTVGIVSCVNRPAEELGLRNYSMTYIQTDASITFGNSGGPLVNLDGDVIGINNLRLTSGISFAIPVEYAKKFLENSKISGKAGQIETVGGKPLFGMTTISVTLDVINDLLRERKNIPEGLTQGLLVWKLLKGTPAQQSGVEVGDIITHINGVPVNGSADLYKISDVDEQLVIELIREGKKKLIYIANKDMKNYIL